MRILIICCLAVLVGACSSNTKPEKTPADTLVDELKFLEGKGILFGHQDDLAYGMTWSYELGQSDVKLLSSDYPAIAGWELGGIELLQAKNLDGVPFDYMKKAIVWADNKGIINTISWHPFSPIDSCSSWTKDEIVVPHLIEGGDYHQEYIKQLDILANFFSSLKDSEGNLIPIIFRPFHEMDGTWFWWGQQSCSPEEFIDLFRFTIKYLTEDKGLDNLVVAYSPDTHFEDADSYLTWYPGDDIVDVLGHDNYQGFKSDNPVESVTKKLKIVIELAKSKNKISALTETGLSNVTDSTWFKSKFLPVLKDPEVANNLSYAMVWRSDPAVHFFFSYPGHPSEADTKEFLNDPHIWLLNDMLEGLKGM